MTYRHSNRKLKSKTAVRSNPKLWRSIVKKVKKEGKGGRPNQWSARKAQRAVYLYKKSGGKYIGKKSYHNSLSKWTKQRWRTKSGRPSIMGPNPSGERYLPTRTIQRMSNKNYLRTSRKKRRDTKRRIQYSRQPF